MSATLLEFVPNCALAPGNAAIAEALERLATLIRSGELGELATVLCVIEPRDEELTYRVYGDRLDHARAIGLLTMLAVKKANG